MTYLMFALGLIGLTLGGEWLVRGAVGVAHRFAVPPLVIGLTIVGFGTSAPELLVSVQAALSGSPALAIGNVIGSNIANILLILGVTALIAAIPLPFRALWRDLAVLLGATLALWALLASGTIGRGAGAGLLVLLAAYLWQSVKSAQVSDHIPEGPVRPLVVSAGIAVLGLLTLMVGAKLLVTSATEIARDLGVSDAVIGLTVVAVGTSLPELATSAIAALRRHPELAVGNVIGSCIFNIFGILGTTALITPIPVDPRFAGTDIVVALGAAVVLVALSLAGRVPRTAGVGLLIAYAAYIYLTA